MIASIGSISSHPFSQLVSVTVRVSSRGKVCLNCSFSADELTGCVGVIHSAQLDNLTLTVLSVERSGGVNCTVDELREGNYSVAVFGWLPGNILEQEPAYVAYVSVKSQPLGRLCVVSLFVDFYRFSLQLLLLELSHYPVLLE